MTNRYNYILNHGLRMGALMGAIFILYSLILYIADFNMMNVAFGIANFLVSILIYVLYFRWANIDLRIKHLNGWLTYPEGLLHAFIVGVVAAVINTVYTYLFYSFFDTEYLPKMGEKVLEMLENNPNITQKMLEEAEQKIKEMTPLKSALQGFYFSMGMSVVIALIISAFTIKKKEIFEDVAINDTDEAL